VIGELGPEVSVAQPKSSAPKVPFLARAASHRRATRKGPPPVIVTGKPDRLTREELDQAADLMVWTVWCQDTFGFGDDRDPPFVVSIHLGRDAAEAELKRLYNEEAPFTHYWVGESRLAVDLLNRRLVSAERLRAIIQGQPEDRAPVTELPLEPEAEKSKDLWRGSLIAAVVITLILMLAFTVLRHLGVMSGAQYPWWAEASWLLGVAVTALQTWLGRRRTLFGVACVTLLWPPYLVIPDLPLALTGFLGFVALWAATGFPRASAYVWIGVAAEVYFAPIIWMGEALRALLGAPSGGTPETGLDRFLKPDLAWVFVLVALWAVVRDEPHSWTRVLFVAGWIGLTEGLAAARSASHHWSFDPPDHW